MKEKFEQQGNNERSGGREAVAIVLLIISALVFLVLVTKDLILGSFGTLLANFVLGVFGFAAYAVSLAVLIGSILTLFSNRSKKNALSVFSLVLILFAGLIALQIWTAAAVNIYNKPLTFSEFLNESYNLNCIGFNGASAGGVIMSAIIYYPVKFIKIAGVYTFAAIIFVGGAFGLYAAIRKKYFGGFSKKRNNDGRINYGNYSDNFGQNNGMPNNANRIQFGSRLNDLPYQQTAQTDFNGQNLFGRVEPPIQTAQQPQQEYQDARSILYPQYSNLEVAPNNPVMPKEDNFVGNSLKGLNKQRDENRLFIFNSAKNNQFTQKSKKEIDKEEKQRKAIDILYPDKDEEGSDFSVSNYNRPRNLALDRNEYNPRRDKIRDESLTDIFNKNFGNVSREDLGKHDDSDKRVDFVNKPFEQIPDNLVENANVDISSKKNFDEFEDSSNGLNTLYNSEEPDLNDKSNVSRDKLSKQAEERKKIEDGFRPIVPTNIPPIMRASDLKKEKEQRLKEEEVKQAEQAANSDKDISADSQSEFYTKEDYENNTRELKDLISSGKIINGEVDLSKINYSYAKEMPKNPDKISIISNVNQVKSRNFDNVDAINKDILNSNVDEAFDNLDLSDNSKIKDIDDLPEKPYYKREDSESIIDSPIYVKSDDGFGGKAEDSKTYGAFYQVKEPKIIKTPSGDTASQLPIIASNSITRKSDNGNARRPLNSGLSYVYPPIDLLKRSETVNEDHSEEIAERSETLEKVLSSFGIGAKVVSTVEGPVVTRYELEIEPGVSVKRVELLSKDISMALESPSEVIIQAPIPGRNCVGVEVPNRRRAIVSMREIAESEQFKTAKSPVVFVLGKDVAGKTILCDIKRMPHLLIAGSTGMGKSVCLNSLIISLLYHATPDDVRIILVDPKRVEFNIYQGLPHLLIDEIINDAEKAISAFDWAIEEMERRFNLFQSTKTRDIDSYNAVIDLTTDKKLPRIVIIVDEVSDLMSYNKKELEGRIIRIAQKARAAGIHLILATQRPSVDVITGVIKANLPSRISFKLSNGIDSKTVLDEVGAEKLLGYGDMFYKPADFSEKMRVQGCFVDTPEVDKIVNFVIANNVSEYDEDAKKAINAPKSSNTESEETSNGSSNLSDIAKDDTFKDAVRLAIESSQISISLIQRRYSVGYSKAGRIIDTMERMGYISPFNGSKAREVYVTREQFERDFGEPY